MKGKVQSKTITSVVGSQEDTFDVVITLVDQEPLEFRITTYEEKVAVNFAKIDSEIEIEISDHGRLKTLIAPYLKYTNR